MAENWVKSACSEARAAFDARSEVEVELGALKENHSKLAEQLKEAVRARDSDEAGLKTTEKQFEDIRKQLHYNEINLATEKQLVTELREELWKARKAVQLVKEAADAEKQAAYMLRVEETQARLTDEFFVVCKDYCDISWGKALDVVRVPVDSDLRRPESITTIQKFASFQVLTPFTMDKPVKYLCSQRRTKSLLPLWKFQKTPTKMLAKERRLKLSRARIKVKIRRKILLIPKRKLQIPLSLSSAKLLTQGSLRRKLKLGGFYYFCMFFFFVILFVVSC